MKHIRIPIHGPTEIPTLVRCFAEPCHKCGLCGHKSQEQAGREYFELLGWSMCCSCCWGEMCIEYWNWLNGRENTIMNFCRFICTKE